MHTQVEHLPIHIKILLPVISPLLLKFTSRTFHRRQIWLQLNLLIQTTTTESSATDLSAVKARTSSLRRTSHLNEHYDKELNDRIMGCSFQFQD